MKKIIFAVAVIALLAWIGWSLQQSENRQAAERHDRARLAAAYLDCRAHAKDPDLCMAP